jgi:hypothetical protein
MKNAFYTDWLEINKPSNRYHETIKHCQIVKSESIVVSSGQVPSRGYICKNANKLRNGNTYLDVKLKGTGKKISINRLSDKPVEELYSNDKVIIARHEHTLSVYNITGCTKIAEIGWTGRKSTLFINENVFCAIGDLLEYLTFEGAIEQRIKILLANRLQFFDTIVNGKAILVAGYLDYPDIPDGYDPLAFIQQIPYSDISAPKGKSQLCSIQKQHMLAWYTDRAIQPVITSDFIIQQTPFGTAIVTPEMKVTCIIENDFDTALISADPDGLIYLFGVKNNQASLSVFNSFGVAKYVTNIDSFPGTGVAPPMITPSKKVYCCGEQGFVFFDETGKIIDTGRFPEQKTVSCTVLYNETLLVSNDTYIVKYEEGNLSAIHIEPTLGSINTQCLTAGPDTLVVGTDTGLYLLT